MGLDWMWHGGEPKSGCEKQFHCINEMLSAPHANASNTES